MKVSNRDGGNRGEGRGHATELRLGQSPENSTTLDQTRSSLSTGTGEQCFVNLTKISSALQQSADTIGELEIPIISTVDYDPNIDATSKNFIISGDVSRQSWMETVPTFPCSDTTHDLDTPSILSRSGSCTFDSRGFAGVLEEPSSDGREKSKVWNGSTPATAGCNGRPTVRSSQDRHSHAGVPVRDIKYNSTRTLGTPSTLPCTPIELPLPLRCHQGFKVGPELPTGARPRGRLPRANTSPRSGRPSPPHLSTSPPWTSPASSPAKAKTTRAFVQPPLHKTCTTTNNTIKSSEQALHASHNGESPTWSREHVHATNFTPFQDTVQPTNGTKVATTTCTTDGHTLPPILTVHSKKAVKPVGVSFRVVYTSGYTLRDAVFRLHVRTHHPGRGRRSVAWSVERRYDNFDAIHKTLQGSSSANAASILPCLPRNLETSTPDHACNALQSYLEAVAADVPFAWGVESYVLFLDDTMGRRLFGRERGRESRRERH